jgi:hypothetical protein
MVLPHSLFQTVSEYVFSETRIQPVASLCGRTRAMGFRSSPRSTYSRPLLGSPALQGR